MTRRVDRRADVEAAVTGPPEAADRSAPVDPALRRRLLARRFRRQAMKEEAPTDGNP